MDRIIASRMAASAVEALIEGECNIMIGTDGDRLVRVSLRVRFKRKKNTSRFSGFIQYFGNIKD